MGVVNVTANSLANFGRDGGLPSLAANQFAVLGVHLVHLIIEMALNLDLNRDLLDWSRAAIVVLLRDLFVE